MSNGGDSLEPGQHRFGPWQFDAGTGDLYDGASTIRLEPQVAKLLAYFLLHQDTLISREQLIAEVWESRVVSDDAINRCVSILRQTLSPDDRSAYIETVVRRGFVSHFPPASAEEPPERKPRPQRKYLLLAGLIGVAALALFLILQKSVKPGEAPPAAPRQDSPMVAVLPFATAGMAGESEFFANGVHDDLITRLAQLQSLRVISRTSVLGYRDSQLNVREIGRELGADAILEGSVQRIGDRIRINAQLIDARSDEHLWAEQYDRELSTANIFDVQTEIARAVAFALQTALTKRDVRDLAVLPTDDMAAYRAYHRAMEIRDQRSPSSPDYFAALEEAVALDPTFARAWAELAGGLCYSVFYDDDPVSILRIEQIIEHIRALAPGSAEHLIAQAYYTYYVLRDYDQAYGLIVQAQDLRPSDERILELKSWIQRRQGDYAGKIESTRLAQRVDPRNPGWTVILVNSLLVNHQYDEAAREVESAPVRTFELALAGSRLELRKTRNPGSWAGTLAALEREYGVAAEPWDWWDAHVANRDFAAAEAMLPALEAVRFDEKGFFIGGYFRYEVVQIITYWFLQSGDRLDELLNQAGARIAEGRRSADDRLGQSQDLEKALLAAAAGDSAEAERLVRNWRRAATKDLAERGNLLHYACRILGMAEAAAAAVECIREGLEEPSYVTPFIEPFLPYYDAIRDEPVFQQLLADIQDG